MNRRAILCGTVLVVLLSGTLAGCLPGLPKLGSSPTATEVPVAAKSAPTTQATAAAPAKAAPTQATAATKAPAPTAAPTKAPAVAATAPVTATVAGPAKTPALAAAVTPIAVMTSTAVATTKAITATGALTVTPPATPFATSQPIRIQFPRGATSDKIDGHIEPGRQLIYVLRAATGQQMSVQASAANGAVEITIVGADRKPLGIITSPKAWMGTLPASQDYYLMVTAPRNGRATNFSLTISIVGDPRPEAGTAAEPIVVRFEPGTDTTQISGQVAPSKSMIYTLEGKTRQKLTVSIEANGPVRAAITDPSGVLVGVAYPNEPWSGTLPKAGEYRISVQAPVDVGMVVYLIEFALK